VSESVLTAPSLQYYPNKLFKHGTCRVVFYFSSPVDLASNAEQLCHSNLKLDYHDRFLQGLLRNKFSLSSVDLSKTCVELCKTSEPCKMKAVRSVETSGTA
jgi:hypothetical protein